METKAIKKIIDEIKLEITVKESDLTDSEIENKSNDRLQRLKDLIMKLSSSEEIEMKENKITEELKRLNAKIKNCYAEIEKINSENIKLKEILYSNSTSFGSEVKIQTIPVDIYIDSEDPSAIFGVYDAVLDFVSSIGFEKAFEFKAIKGSWFKKMLAKSKEAITSDKVTDRLKEAEYGIEVNTILKPLSEVEKNQSEALLNILKSIESIKSAAIRIGSLLVVKLTNSEGEINVQVRTLSIKELHLLNKRPELLNRPQEILTALSLEIEVDSPSSN